MSEESPENRMLNFYIQRPEVAPIVHAIFSGDMEELRADPEQYIKDNLTIRPDEQSKAENERHRKKRHKKASKRRTHSNSIHHR